MAVTFFSAIQYKGAIKAKRTLLQNETDDRWRTIL
jgi:hypothetical protein